MRASEMNDDVTPLSFFVVTPRVTPLSTWLLWLRYRFFFAIMVRGKFLRPYPNFKFTTGIAMKDVNFEYQ